MDAPASRLKCVSHSGGLERHGRTGDGLEKHGRTGDGLEKRGLTGDGLAQVQSPRRDRSWSRAERTGDMMQRIWVDAAPAAHGAVV